MPTVETLSAIRGYHHRPKEMALFAVFPPEEGNLYSFVHRHGSLRSVRSDMFSRVFRCAKHGALSEARFY